MGLKARAIRFVEANDLPDGLTRAAIAALVAQASRKLANKPAAAERHAFADAMRDHPIAMYTAAANTQHYELPPEFFARVLGPARKYSCCYYPLASTTLADAERHALAETAALARVEDGQSILELGCGWGSLSLWLASNYPRSRVIAVSNSRSQRHFIEKEIAARHLGNLRVVTADVNVFQPDVAFDRVVSVEMFEHVSNWPALLGRVRSWLKPDGLFFMHVFSHERIPYRFDHKDETDWIGKYFFTGGIMPSHDLIREFHESFRVEQDWRWSGEHYQRTAIDWLANFDAEMGAIRGIFESVYGKDTELWLRRWRLFFLATAGLFGHRSGGEWGVSHYLLRPAR